MSVTDTLLPADVRLLRDRVVQGLPLSDAERAQLAAALKTLEHDLETSRHDVAELHRLLATAGGSGRVPSPVSAKWTPRRDPKAWPPLPENRSKASLVDAVLAGRAKR